MARARQVPKTDEEAIDGLLSGLAWQGDLSFGFPGSAAEYGPDYVTGEPATGFASASPALRQAVRAALLGAPAAGGGGNAVLRGMGVADVTLLHVTEGGAASDMRIARSGLPPTAQAYFPGAEAGGDVWFGTRYAGTSNDYGNPVPGNYAYQSILHELGHALGLKHGQEAGGPGDTALPATLDSLEFSVMTYRSYAGAPVTGSYTYEAWGAPQGWMMLDIQALQAMYGANFGTRSGNTTYRWDPGTGEMSVDGIGQGRPGGNRIFLTLWDGGGVDTYDLSNYATGVGVDLAPGGWSVLSEAQRASLGAGHLARGNVFNALQYQGDPRSLIENAIGGAGNDTLKGNAAGNWLRGGPGADSLWGGAGNDTLDSGTGADSMAGGPGNDTVMVNHAGDVVTEAAGEGFDTVIASIDWTLGPNLEALTLASGTVNLAGNGNALDNRLTGNAGANRLAGGGGADSIQGGAGDDTLIGGAGADSLAGGAGRDAFRFLSPAEGPDLILDFSAAEDLLEFSAAGFGAGLRAGMDLAAAGRLAINPAGTAIGGAAQLVFGTESRILWWDANGAATGGAVKLATLAGATGLAAADFHLIA
ncbi:M10 family metallopeptidase [Paracraurococcus lichenis]|uniref:M10 family metallopeptidase n=1 Tax=Paracraurococcus lichenis TaxID=3064888 RepID=A0ABT9DVM9_9PROT|nr:M10 family metallopeptidase [Paracraurococcus sp. LOR1-02]MDO9707938.1 M10 family metallopeptidase [Paracraurococcus sp. LOR1-02]